MYSGKMLSVCRYYIRDLHFAEDVMIKSFFKAFTAIEKYQEKSSFYTWLKSIITNECIDFLRSKTNRLEFAAWDENMETVSDEMNDELNLKELQQKIDELPDGCKIIFNLYVMEEMKHSEIAEKLQISVGTSKSQLSYARKCLMEKLNLKKSYHV